VPAPARPRATLAAQSGGLQLLESVVQFAALDEEPLANEEERQEALASPTRHLRGANLKAKRAEFGARSILVEDAAVSKDIVQRGVWAVHVNNP
jgi:hypothetical protein